MEEGGGASDGSGCGRGAKQSGAVALEQPPAPKVAVDVPELGGGPYHVTDEASAPM